MSTPSLKPIELKEHTCKQGHYGDIVPKLTMRSMLVGPRWSGKTVLLTNMILAMYKGCFSRIPIWSPSIDVASTWKHVNIISETIPNQTVERNAILIHTIHQNLNKVLKHNNK